MSTTKIGLLIIAGGILLYMSGSFLYFYDLPYAEVRGISVIFIVLGALFMLFKNRK